MILVMAANGETGRQVIRALRERREPVRALARTEASGSRAALGRGGDGRWRHAERSTMGAALAGVRAAVHIGPAFHPFETAMGQAVFDAASAAGVRRLVQFSIYHPQLDFLVNHQAKLRVEDYVVNSGLDYTILQPMHYIRISNRHRSPATVYSSFPIRCLGRSRLLTWSTPR